MNVRLVTAKDYDQWKPLFESYCKFYHEVATEEKIKPCGTGFKILNIC